MRVPIFGHYGIEVGTHRARAYEPLTMDLPYEGEKDYTLIEERLPEFTLSSATPSR